jgi:predicted tellurium resistance membrane protein TerC
MNNLYPLWYAVFAFVLGVIGMIIRYFCLFDTIANLSFPYLCLVIAFALMIVGIHCLLFCSHPSDLSLKPNLILFLIISSLSLIVVIWDGLGTGFDSKKIIYDASNAAGFIIFYAAFLFLPRLSKKSE